MIGSYTQEIKASVTSGVLLDIGSGIFGTSVINLNVIKQCTFTSIKPSTTSMTVTHSLNPASYASTIVNVPAYTLLP